MNTVLTTNAPGAPAMKLLSAKELNAYLDALTESFNQLKLGYVRRSRIFAVPSGWCPEGLTLSCWVTHPARGFLALEIEPRLAQRIALYMTPKRSGVLDKDVRAALQMIGDDVTAGMVLRLVRAGIHAKISAPEVLNPLEWKLKYTTDLPMGIVPLYSTCGICYLAFNLFNPA